MNAALLVEPGLPTRPQLLLALAWAAIALKMQQ